MLEIQKFILSHLSDWETLLSNPPYSLNIKKKDKRILFKYSQYSSDFSLDIVKEARGLILEDKTWKIVCYPFNKFFNYGEQNADKINWTSAKVTCKEDGSLIKIYYYNGWQVATNGTIDAIDAKLTVPPYHNFRQLFDVAAKNSNFNFDKLDPRYTYMIELVSYANQIVIKYNEPQLFHLATRNNITLQEEEIDIGIQKPKSYQLFSLDDCIAMANTFGIEQEGFVVCDKNYNRIKIKSLEYLVAHHLLNNNALTEERAINLIRTNELEEFLNYFPQYTDFISKIKIKMEQLFNYLNKEKEKIVNYLYLDRKSFSKVANESVFPFLWYKVYDDNNLIIENFLGEFTNKKLMQLIKQMEDFNVSCN